MEEAIEAMRDPYFQQFVKREASIATVLTEVKEFRRYSSDITAAWEAVEALAARGETFHARREGERWLIAFGRFEPLSARTAALAICLAALRARGVEVDCDVTALEAGFPAAAGVPGGEVRSLYDR